MMSFLVQPDIGLHVTTSRWSVTLRVYRDKKASWTETTETMSRYALSSCHFSDLFGYSSDNRRLADGAKRQQTPVASGGAMYLSHVSISTELTFTFYQILLTSDKVSIHFGLLIFLFRSDHWLRKILPERHLGSIRASMMLILETYSCT